MPHDIKDMQRREHVPSATAGATFSLFDLSTNDAAAVVEAANYLALSAAALSKGDIIRARMALGGTPVLKQYIVTSASGAASPTIAVQTVAAG